MEKATGVNLTNGYKCLPKDGVKSAPRRKITRRWKVVHDADVTKAVGVNTKADVEERCGAEVQAVKSNVATVANEASPKAATVSTITDTTLIPSEESGSTGAQLEPAAKENSIENGTGETIEDIADTNATEVQSEVIPEVNQSEEAAGVDSASEGSVSQSDCEPLHELSLHFKCGQCAETFESVAALQAHKDTDHNSKPGKSFQCDQCHREFKANYRLLCHKRTHTGERPYNCADCNASFMTKQVLENHVRIHLGDRPFKCGTCDASFVQKAGLRRHMYVHMRRRRYKCDTCDASFPTKLLLAKHSYSHDCDNPVKKCHTCDLEFESSSELRRHSGLHLDRKTFTCEVCGDTFALSRTLRNHMRKHGNAVKQDKAFVCEVCQKDFSRDSDLSRHKKMVHVVRSNEKCRSPTPGCG